MNTPRDARVDALLAAVCAMATSLPLDLRMRASTVLRERAARVRTQRSQRRTGRAGSCRYPSRAGMHAVRLPICRSSRPNGAAS
jgi:hypothetical protein